VWGGNKNKNTGRQISAKAAVSSLYMRQSENIKHVLLFPFPVDASAPAPSAAVSQSLMASLGLMKGGILRK
jgi:hypothetical protein